MRHLLIAFLLLAIPGLAFGACPSLPYTLTNGQTADANQVMANLNSVNTCAGNAASGGANSNITSLSGLTTPLSIPQGGTGATTGAAAISALGGVLGANNGSDFTSPSTTLTTLGGVAKANNGSDFANTTTTFNTLTPPQASHANQFLQTNGATTSWAAQSLVSPTVALFVNQQTSGSSSGEAINAATWTQRILNTATLNTITGATLTSNQVSLPAGTYEVFATAQALANPAALTEAHKLRLRNITDTATILVGQNTAQTSSGTAGVSSTATLQGQFTIAATKTVELDSFVTTASNGGLFMTSGEPEIYVSVYFRKVG